MQLTGTIQKRTAAAIQFLKAHRTKSYDRNEMAAVYQRAGVPFTEAADKFFQEWYGVVDGAYFYKIAKETNKFHNEGDTVSIDCNFYLFTTEEEIKDWYDSSPLDETADDDSCDSPTLIKRKYGADTVPVAEGGYYYPGCIYVRPDGRLLIFHPDYDYSDDGDIKTWEYNNFFELMWHELSNTDPGFVETIFQIQHLSGTLMARIYAAVKFANAHGGFKSCRLFSSFHHPWDTSQMPNDPELTDDELAASLLQILERQCSRPENIVLNTIWHIAK